MLKFSDRGVGLAETFALAALRSKRESTKDQKDLVRPPHRTNLLNPGPLPPQTLLPDPQRPIPGCWGHTRCAQRPPPTTLKLHAHRPAPSLSPRTPRKQLGRGAAKMNSASIAEFDAGLQRARAMHCSCLNKLKKFWRLAQGYERKGDSVLSRVLPLKPPRTPPAGAPRVRT